MVIFLTQTHALLQGKSLAVIFIGESWGACSQSWLLHAAWMMVVSQQKGLWRHGPWSDLCKPDFGFNPICCSFDWFCFGIILSVTSVKMVIILTSSLLRFWCTQIHTFLRHGLFHSFWSCSQHVAPHSFGFSALVAENPQKRWKMMEAWPCYSCNMFFHVFSIVWGCLDLRGFSNSVAVWFLWSFNFMTAILYRWSFEQYPACQNGTAPSLQ